MENFTELLHRYHQKIDEFKDESISKKRRLEIYEELRTIEDAIDVLAGLRG